MTETAKHTPAPWNYGHCADRDGDYFAILREKINDYGLPTPADYIGRVERETDARLIAAAPEFFQSAETMHLEINGLHATMRATSIEYRQSELCRRMDQFIADNAAAIAKATGQNT